MKKIKILAVDDDIDDIEILQEAIKDTGESVECIIALNGIDALEKLDSMKRLPDLIFLDVNMPRLNGKECLQHLRNHDRFKDIPVVMHSTTILDDDELYFQSLRAFVLRKEIDFKALVSHVKEFITGVTVSAGN